MPAITFNRLAAAEASPLVISGAHSNRRVEPEPHPLMSPPVLRDLLMQRHRLLMAAVRSQVAGNRGLNVNRLHVL
jgi:hypothetical protein